MSVDIPSVACACLGMLIGALVIHFVVRTPRFDLKALIGAVGVLGSIGALAVFDNLGLKAGPAGWWYIIGLFIGAGFIAALHYKPDQQT